MRFQRKMSPMGHPPGTPQAKCLGTERDPFIFQAGAVGRKVSSESEISSIQIPEESAPRGLLGARGRADCSVGWKKCATTRSLRSALLLALGILSSLLGVLCLIFSSSMEAAILKFLQLNTALTPGPMLTTWLDPPIVPHLEIHLYNITNPQEVLEGLDPELAEIGPYVYSAQHVRTLVQENTPYPNSISFNARTIYRFQPHLSAGLETDRLTTLNLVMLTGFTKARPEAEMIRRGIAWPLLTSTGRKRPILDLTVGGFLFGYEDELACILDGDSGASGGEAPETNEEEDEWVDWNEEDKEEKEKKEEAKTLDGIPSYREKSGKCMWGLLKHLNTTNTDIIR